MIVFGTSSDTQPFLGDVMAFQESQMNFPFPKYGNYAYEAIQRVRILLN